jgi:hypothetical protein
LVFIVIESRLLFRKKAVMPPIGGLAKVICGYFLGKGEIYD